MCNVQSELKMYQRPLNENRERKLTICIVYHVLCTAWFTTLYSVAIAIYIATKQL